MSDEQPLPAFPNYEPPNPNGVPFQGDKFHKPLLSLARQMMKPKAPTRAPSKSHKGKGIHTNDRIHIGRKKIVWY